MINCSNLLRKSYGLKNSTIFGYEYTFNRKICCCYFCNFVYYVTLSRDPLWLSQLSFTKFVIFVILSIIATSLMAPFRFWYTILSICAILFLPSSFSRPRRIFQVVFFFSVFYEFCLIFAIFFLLKLWRKFDGQRAW